MYTNKGAIKAYFKFAISQSKEILSCLEVFASKLF